MPASSQVAAIRKQKYDHLPSPHQTFYKLLAQQLTAHPNAAVLNIGCGTGNHDQFDWPAYANSIYLIGLDVDPNAAANPHVEMFVLADTRSQWPLVNSSIDFATCRSVLEHVYDPDHFFANLHRVLKPGGELLFITPNVLHPLMMASAVLPTRVKARLLKSTMNKQEEDTFPTVYRVNNRWTIQQKARQHGFEIVELQVAEWQPSRYLDFSLPAFRLSEFYYQVMHATGLERYFGINIIGLLRKA